MMMELKGPPYPDKYRLQAQLALIRNLNQVIKNAGGGQGVFSTHTTLLEFVEKIATNDIGFHNVEYKGIRSKAG